MERRVAILFAFIVTLSTWCRAAGPTAEDYARAERALPANYRQLIYNEQVTPNWIAESDRFWYRSDDPDGHRFYFVDPENRVSEPAFDHQKVAAAISLHTGEATEALDLPFESIEFSDDEQSVEFTVGEERWTCNRDTSECTQEPAEEPQPEQLRSPDEKWALVAREHNLYLLDVESGDERQLTDDGEKHYAYAAEPEGRTTAVRDLLRDKKSPPSAAWSADSKRILTHRLDERKVREMHLIQATDLGEGEHRPVLHSYRYPLIGDEHVAKCEPLIIDVESGDVTRVDAEPHETPYVSALRFKDWWWSEDGQRVYLLRTGRASKSLTLERVDPANGETEVLIEETGETYVEARPSLAGRPNVRELAGGAEILWYSERDGWAHLYVYNAESGELLRQITSGPWAVQQIKYVDEDARTVYFTVNGAPGIDNLYHRQLFLTDLDSGEVRRLSDADAYHDISFSPAGGYYVETVSRVDVPGVSAVRSATHPEYRLPLTEADISRLREMNVRLPVPFRVKAADGTTDIYGIAHFPSHFDPEKSYPVIDSIYPGPQVNRAQHSLTGVALRRIGGDAALAELGFIVVNIDGRGKPRRSKAFHDWQYGKMEVAGALEDHIAAIRQLADRYPSIDLSRVGIHGHSGGGFATARAMFAYPDFYKVGVSSAGNHDQRGYLSDWGEKYQGLLGEADYEKQANAEIAHRLEGKLLLAFGELDDNVHPALTIQVIDALVKANKDFDLMIIPKGHHDFSIHPYFIRRIWDYFVTHLLDEDPPAEYAIDAESIAKPSPYAASQEDPES